MDVPSALAACGLGMRRLPWRQNSEEAKEIKLLLLDLVGQLNGHRCKHGTTGKVWTEILEAFYLSDLVGDQFEPVKHSQLKSQFMVKSKTLTSLFLLLLLTCINLLSQKMIELFKDPSQNTSGFDGDDEYRVKIAKLAQEMDVFEDGKKDKKIGDLTEENHNLENEIVATAQGEGGKRPAAPDLETPGRKAARPQPDGPDALNAKFISILDHLASPSGASSTASSVSMSRVGDRRREEALETVSAMYADVECPDFLTEAGVAVDSAAHATLCDLSLAVIIEFYSDSPCISDFTKVMKECDVPVPAAAKVFTFLKKKVNECSA